MRRRAVDGGESRGSEQWFILPVSHRVMSAHWHTTLKLGSLLPQAVAVKMALAAITLGALDACAQADRLWDFSGPKLISFHACFSVGLQRFRTVRAKCSLHL